MVAFRTESEIELIKNAFPPPRKVWKNGVRTVSHTRTTYYAHATLVPTPANKNMIFTFYNVHRNVARRIFTNAQIRLFNTDIRKKKKNDVVRAQHCGIYRRVCACCNLYGTHVGMPRTQSRL